MVYPTADITVDIIVYHRRTNSILLIKRKKEPFKDKWALPGGFFNSEAYKDSEQDYSIRRAAQRELLEETNIDVALADIKFFTILDSPHRDPRGRVVSIVYTVTLWGDTTKEVGAKAKDDAAEIMWFDLRNLRRGRFAFDHGEAIENFYCGLTYQ